MAAVTICSDFGPQENKVYPSQTDLEDDISQLKSLQPPFPEVYMKMQRTYRNLRKSETKLKKSSYLTSHFLHKVTEVGITVRTSRQTQTPEGRMCVKVAQSCPTLRPTDCRVHGMLQARILEWVAFPISSGSSQPRNQTSVSSFAGRVFTNCAIRKALGYT